MHSDMPTLGARPVRSVSDIVKDAQAFDHSSLSAYSLTIILRTAQNILNQAANSERDGDIEQTYLFLYRHADFCMARIATHPDRKLPQHKSAVARVTGQVVADLETLEKLRPELHARYDAYRAALVRETRRGQSIPAVSNQAPATPIDYEQRSAIALQIARRRYQGQTANRMDLESDDDLLSPFRKLNSQDIKQAARRDGPDPNANPAFNYPSVPTMHQMKAPLLPGKLPILSASAQQPDSMPPPLPSKVQLVPPIPAKTQAAFHQMQTPYTFQSHAKTESGHPLRPLFLPRELHTTFLDAARRNTERNLETCGILAATLISGALFISHLIVPAQSSTSDTCDTTPAGDSALFDYVDAASLLVCGWIHTHPTQSCFLSSRDLHTSLGYQVMLEESVSIVCAPKHDPDYGVFRLTDPPGVAVISACDEPGIFHPHHVGGLYTAALRPGHVSELAGLSFELVDLRDG